MRAIAAENIAPRKQLIIFTRNQKRAPKLTTGDQITFGILAKINSVFFAVPTDEPGQLINYPGIA